MQLLEANLAVLKDSTTLLPASTKILAAFKKKKKFLINRCSPLFPLPPSRKKKRGKTRGKIWVPLQIYSNDKLVLSFESFELKKKSKLKCKITQIFKPSCFLDFTE